MKLLYYLRTPASPHFSRRALLALCLQERFHNGAPSQRQPFAIPGMTLALTAAGLLQWGLHASGVCLFPDL